MRVDKFAMLPEIIFQCCTRGAAAGASQSVHGLDHHQELTPDFWLILQYCWDRRITIGAAMIINTNAWSETHQSRASLIDWLLVQYILRQMSTHYTPETASAELITVPPETEKSVKERFAFACVIKLSER